MVEAAHGILPREDSDGSGIVLERMKKDGVKLLCCGKELKLQKGEGDTVRLTTNSHGKQYDISVDQLLVAVGRAPNVEGLNLEGAGVEFIKKGGDRR